MLREILVTSTTRAAFRTRTSSAPRASTSSFPLAPDMNMTADAGRRRRARAQWRADLGNFAAPGDDIFQEAATFDACGGHPQMTGEYHYHTEPYAISDDDDAFIGVMRDGYPIYGRHDPDGSTPTLDAAGGHTSVTVDSPTTPVYHYHLNLQTSTSPTTLGDSDWFLPPASTAGRPPPARPATEELTRIGEVIERRQQRGATRAPARPANRCSCR